MIDHPAPRKSRSYFQLLVAWLVFAFNGVIARSIDVPLPLLLAIMSAAGAFTCLILRPGKIEWSGNAFLVALILIFDGLFVFLAFQRISFATTIALHYAGPILVTLLAPYVVNEKFRPRSLIYAIGGFIAVGVLCNLEIRHASGRGIDGIIFACLSAITLALNILYQRKFMKQTANYKAAVLQYDVLMTIGYGLLAALWPLAIDSAVYRNWHPDLAALLYTVGAGAIMAGVAMLLFNSAARFVPSDIIARMAFTEVAWVVLLGAAIYHEIPSLLQFAAIAAIFVMSSLAQREGATRA
jgi:drug/metabolite transporter (DMT)-like permease